jgi:RNA polymerase sigma-70 factor (ECF subfamily)
LSARDLQRRIDAARNGSGDALGLLLSACRDYLLFVANREVDGNLRAKISPSDVVQETCVQAHQCFPGFAGNSEGELLAWLRRILINNVSGGRRRYRETAARNVNIEISLNDSNNGDALGGLLADSITPSRYALLNEQLRAVEQVLAALPVDYQQVLRLRYWEKLPLTEIAQQMDRTPDAVQKLWFRAIERFKREFKKDGGRGSGA